VGPEVGFLMFDAEFLTNIVPVKLHRPPGQGQDLTHFVWSDPMHQGFPDRDFYS
jgi:hypothetical protein